MGAAVKIIDEEGPGQIVRTTILQLAGERLSVRELIEQRVRAEVRRHNGRTNEVFAGLVQPTEAEVVANGYRLKPAQQVDEDVQAALALEGFENGGFLLLVDDRQVTEPDEQLVLSPDSTLTFIKLVPLVGG